MTSPLTAQAAQGDLLEQAHEVLARLPRTEADPLDHADVRAFMSISAEHRQTMLRVARVWSALGSVNQLPWPTADELAGDDERDDDAALPGDRTARGSLWRWAAAFAVLVVGLWGGRIALERPATESYQTMAGEHRTIELRDSSRIHLGARTRLTATFSSQARAVVLGAGEALFEVAHDAQRPFTVRSGDASTTAIGTAFNIRHADSRTVVSVAEGVVSIRLHGREGEEHRLAVGDQVAIEGDAVGPIVRRDVKGMTAWRTGRFIYMSEPLAAVIEDLSRYSAQPLAFEGESSARLVYTGIVVRERLDDWLAALEAAFPVSIEREDDRIVVRELPR